MEGKGDKGREEGWRKEKGEGGGGERRDGGREEKEWREREGMEGGMGGEEGRKRREVHAMNDFLLLLYHLGLVWGCVC